MGPEEEILSRAREAFFSFQEEISLPRGRGGTGKEIWQRFEDTDPRLVFYCNGWRFVRQQGGTMVFHVEYKNTDWPPDQFYDTKDMPLDQILHEVISNYELRAPVIVRSGNFGWTYESFLKQYYSFYPNFRGMKSVMEYSSGTSKLKIFDMVPRYRIGRVMLRTWEIETQAKVKEIAGQLSLPGMPDYVKAYLAHNYLCGTVKYFNKADATSTERSYIQSAYGALIKRQCVCQGFAEAYKRICGEMGVQCDQIRGQILANGEWHAWNIVHLDGGKKPCYVDCTWDVDKGYGIRYNYFLIGDEALLPVRKWERHYFTPCADGGQEKKAAAAWVREHRKELLEKGADEKYLRPAGVFSRLPGRI